MKKAVFIALAVGFVVTSPVWGIKLLDYLFDENDRRRYK